MNRLNTIITEAAHRAPTLALAAVLLALAAPVFAHGGFDHVIGTVSKVDNNVMTVKTTKGDVDVKLNPQTEITRGDHKAAIEDVKPGTRVIVDIPEGSTDHIAHSVKLGTAAQHSPAHK